MSVHPLGDHISPVPDNKQSQPFSYRKGFTTNLTLNLTVQSCWVKGPLPLPIGVKSLNREAKERVIVYCREITGVSLTLLLSVPFFL